MTGKSLKISINRELLAGIALSCFLLKDPLGSILGIIFGSGTLRTCILVLLLYLPLVLMFCVPGEKREVGDSVALLAIVAAIFGITYLLHPEYKYWLFEGYYPITEYIFFPTTYIYAYLFTRMVKRPETFFSVLKVSGIILLLYNTWRLANALHVGYWVLRSASTSIPKTMSYNLTFGYDMFFLFAIFVYFGTKGNKMYYILGLACGVEILLGGSRGPFILIALYIVILFILKHSELKEKRSFVKISIFMTALIIGCAVMAIIGVEKIVYALSALIETLGYSSRTLTKLLEGSILEDSGRSLLVSTSLDMIKNNWWIGYGAYGDRYVIGEFMATGYCHNFILELLIDYGVIMGGAILIWFSYNSAKMMFSSRYGAWRQIYIILFVCCCKLLLSSSYWYCELLWMALAVIRNAKEWSRQNASLNDVS